ncbi:MAG TPA: hypothetical protein DCE08_01035 [Ruminococcaceae bacterium]|nr:hypothetical protein [Oscillospiraceae bacterium]
MKIAITSDRGRRVRLRIPDVLLLNPICAWIAAAKINKALSRRGETTRVRAITVRKMMSVLRRAKRRGVTVAEIDVENCVKITL